MEALHRKSILVWIRRFLPSQFPQSIAIEVVIYLPSIGGFSEVSGLDSSIEIFDYKEGGRNDYVHKFATRASFGNITFKRGVAVTPGAPALAP